MDSLHDYYCKCDRCKHPKYCNSYTCNFAFDSNINELKVNSDDDYDESKYKQQNINKYKKEIKLIDNISINELKMNDTNDMINYNKRRH